MQKLISTFRGLPPVKQVIVYALALRAEYYELLAVLDRQIPPETKKDFYRSVTLWNA